MAALVPRRRGDVVVGSAEQSGEPQAHQGRLCSPNNVMEVIHTDGPDGSIRPVLSMVFATANDVQMKWTQTLFDIAKATAASGGFGGKLAAYPQCETARRYEAGFWARGSLSRLSGSTLGITMDIYQYDTGGAALMMDRNTYHPGASPTTGSDPSLGGASTVDVASWDGNQTNATFPGWTFFRSIVEQKMWESVYQMRAQFLLHDAVATGSVQIADPVLRPIG